MKHKLIKQHNGKDQNKIHSVPLDLYLCLKYCFNLAD